MHVVQMYYLAFFDPKRRNWFYISSLTSIVAVGRRETLC
jgi:hypothetical protein